MNAWFYLECAVTNLFHSLCQLYMKSSSVCCQKSGNLMSNLFQSSVFINSTCVGDMYYKTAKSSLVMEPIAGY